MRGGALTTKGLGLRVRPFAFGDKRMGQDKVMVFIDGSNFYHGLHRTFGKANVEYRKLGELIAGQRELVQVYYYTAPANQNMGMTNYINQQRFFEHLRRTPKVTLKLGRFLRRVNEFNVVCPNPDCGEEFTWTIDTYVEKGVDVYLAVEMIRFAYEELYDIGILISADGDLTKAVEVAQLLGKRIENIAFKKQKSFHLMKVSNSFEYLEDIITPEVFLDVSMS